MRYSRTSRISPSARLLLALPVVVFLVFILLRFLAPGVFFGAVSPFFALGNAVADNASADEILQRENAELKNENEALKARLQDVGAAEDIPSEAGILAGVIARPPLSPYDTLLLSKGTESGIREGAVVFALGVPVGSIVDARSGFSRAHLYSSSGRTVEGWLGESRLPVTLMGEGAGAFSAQVPRELPVVEGDLVYLPGPGAFPGGTVLRIERSVSSPSATLYIEPLVNPFTLTFVRVLP